MPGAFPPPPPDHPAGRRPPQERLRRRYASAARLSTWPARQQNLGTYQGQVGNWAAPLNLIKKPATMLKPPLAPGGRIQVGGRFAAMTI